MEMSATRDIHIGFDLDGVLIDHEAVKLELARAAGYTLEPWQMASDEFRLCVAAGDQKEIKSLLYGHPDHAFRSPLMSGALPLLKSLQASGVRYSLVSRRRDHAMAFHVLEHAGLRPVFFSDANTFFVPTIQGKEDVCAKLGITHYIDDERDVLAALVSVPHRYLFDPYERTPSPSWPAVRSLEEFHRLIIIQS
jgi:phosphoglycolate phosphatase-like HAD superfamily hydrolase